MQRREIKDCVIRLASANTHRAEAGLRKDGKTKYASFPNLTVKKYAKLCGKPLQRIFYTLQSFFAAKKYMKKNLQMWFLNREPCQTQAP